MQLPPSVLARLHFVRPAPPNPHVPGNLYEPFVDVSELGDGVCAYHSAFRLVMGTGVGKSI